LNIGISPGDAKHLARVLLNNPIAPGRYSRFINAGTEDILDALDLNYFRGQLADGIGCFKYLEGDYGSGKSQFIQNLAVRAGEQDVVTALVTIGIDCPFNSPLAIFRSVMASFQLPEDTKLDGDQAKGIEVLIDRWVRERIERLGAEPGGDVPKVVQGQIEQQIGGLWKGALDTQMAAALVALSRLCLKQHSGIQTSIVGDTELISWVRGDPIRSASLKALGLHEIARDENAFRRLKTVIAFLRSRMGYKGFLVAFDEGTRTSSFRRGSTKERQAIENLLTMINQNAEGEFGGVMFLYAAALDFRTEVVKHYRALQDRIGSVTFSEGSPLVPFVSLDKALSDEDIREIGRKLMTVFGLAFNVQWDEKVQLSNLEQILDAQKTNLYETPKPRFFVYQYCRFLDQQKDEQRGITGQQARRFVESNEPPSDGAEA
jgi:hypothetical protein